MSIKALLADDHNIVRQGVSLVLKQAIPDIQISHASSFTEVIETLNANADIKLIMLDINLPKGNNVSMIEKIKKISPQVKVLMFSAYNQEQYAYKYIKSGADGYIEKSSSENDIVNAVKKVLANEIYMTDVVKDIILKNALNRTDEEKNPLSILSSRELEIAKLLIQGYGNLEISNKLALQMSTVSTYKTRIFEKLEVTNVVELLKVFKTYQDDDDEFND